MQEPFGTPVPSFLSVPPAGYLLLDGSTINSVYVELIQLFGANLPDTRGAVLAGAGANGVTLSQKGNGSLPGLPASTSNANTAVPTGNLLAKAREDTYVAGIANTTTAGPSEFICTHVGVNWVIRARP